jgi:chloramphenicol 3-O-phosphotransferase
MDYPNYLCPCHHRVDVCFLPFGMDIWCEAVAEVRLSRAQFFQRGSGNTPEYDLW